MTLLRSILLAAALAMPVAASSLEIIIEERVTLGRNSMQRFNLPWKREFFWDGRPITLQPRRDHRAHA